MKREQWWASPEGKKELEGTRSKKLIGNGRKRKRPSARRRKKEARKKKKAEEDEIKDLLSARDAAFGEVGITMDRRDRKEMKGVVLLLKKPVHEALRKAAFDKRITMQAILRAGLKMWFIAHDYDVSM